MSNFAARSQAQKLLINARNEVMSEVQHELNFGARKPPQGELTSGDAFQILTRAIQNLYRNGE